MELALSLGGDAVPKPFSFLDKKMAANKDLGFCMGLGDERSSPSSKEADHIRSDDQDYERRVCSSDPPVQLDLLPFSPVHRAQYQPSSQLLFPWLTDKNSMAGRGSSAARSVLPAVEEAEDGAALSSPNTSTTVSSFRVDFPARNRNNKRDLYQLDQSRALSDDEDNALARKKLRLSKDQSAFLEESFKEHNTLNPKQKIALAKQLNLRPRQIEVWFQNRRARTKLKQTEVDCEYLKKCCETLTEENRRLQKELQELRALKSSQPLFMQLPATTLTMCPSCERVATTTSAGATTTTASAATTNTKSSPSLSIAKSPRLVFPFSHAQRQLHQAQAQAQAH